MSISIRPLTSTMDESQMSSVYEIPANFPWPPDPIGYVINSRSDGNGTCSCPGQAIVDDVLVYNVTLSPQQLLSIQTWAALTYQSAQVIPFTASPDPIIPYALDGVVCDATIGLGVEIGRVVGPTPAARVSRMNVSFAFAANAVVSLWIFNGANEPLVEFPLEWGGFGRDVTVTHSFHVAGTGTMLDVIMEPTHYWVIRAKNSYKDWCFRNAHGTLQVTYEAPSSPSPSSSASSGSWFHTHSTTALIIIIGGAATLLVLAGLCFAGARSCRTRKHGTGIPRHPWPQSASLMSEQQQQQQISNPAPQHRAVPSDSLLVSVPVLPPAHAHAHAPANGPLQQDVYMWMEPDAEPGELVLEPGASEPQPQPQPQPQSLSQLQAVAPDPAARGRGQALAPPIYLPRNLHLHRLQPQLQQEGKPLDVHKWRLIAANLNSQPHHHPHSRPHPAIAINNDSPVVSDADADTDTDTDSDTASDGDGAGTGTGSIGSTHMHVTPQHPDHGMLNHHRGAPCVVIGADAAQAEAEAEAPEQTHAQHSAPEGAPPSIHIVGATLPLPFSFSSSHLV